MSWVITEMKFIYSENTWWNCCDYCLGVGRAFGCSPGVKYKRGQVQRLRGPRVTSRGLRGLPR